MQVAGMELNASLEPGWTPLEAVVVLKCIDDEGVVRLHHTSTEALNSWEAVGMLTWCKRSIEDDMAEQDEDPNEC